MSIFRAKFLPFETCILNAVRDALDLKYRALFESQLTCINKIQRLLAWNEIEFYCMRMLRVRWPEPALFSNREEFVIASGLLQADALQATVSLHAVGGHVFSLESRNSLKAFRACDRVRFIVSSAAA